MSAVASHELETVRRVQPVPTPPAKPAAPQRHGTARLTLAIDGTNYNVVPVRNDQRAVVGFSLKKLADGKVIQVNEYADCSCEDYRYVQRKADGQCKHVRALYAVGLLEN